MNLAAAEVGLVDGGDHVHHAARHHLPRSVGGPIYGAGAGIVVTIRTVELEGGGHDPHGVQKIVDGDPFERLNVLEYLFRKERFVRGRGLSDGQPGADQGDNHEFGGREHSSGP